MAQHARKLSEVINSTELKKYVEKLKQKDSVVFFIRPSKATMKNDGVRETVDWDGIIAIDAMIKTLFEIFDIPYVQICTDSMQERVKLVNSVLRFL
jgi:hypothetical protein